MLTTVQFDDQPSIFTDEIRYETIDRHLPAKFPTIELPIAQFLPKTKFRIR